MTDDTRINAEYDLDDDVVKMLMIKSIEKYGDSRVLDDFESLLADNKTLSESFVGAFVSGPFEEIVRIGLETHEEISQEPEHNE